MRRRSFLPKLSTAASGKASVPKVTIRRSGSFSSAARNCATSVGPYWPIRSATGRRRSICTPFEQRDQGVLDAGAGRRRLLDHRRGRLDQSPPASIGSSTTRRNLDGILQLDDLFLLVIARRDRRQAGLLLPVIRDKHRLDRGQRRASGRHHHADIVDRQRVLRLVQPVLEHMRVLFLARPIDAQARDHIDHVVLALFAGEHGVVLAQRGVDLLHHLGAVGLALHRR